MASFFSKSIYKYVPISVGGPTSIIDKEILNFEFIFNESLSYTMDSDLWQRIYLLDYKYKRITKYLWGFRIHEDSKTSHAFTSNPTIKFYCEKQRIINVYYNNSLKLGNVFNVIFKTITGVYFISIFDTIRLRNKNILKNA